MTEHEHFMQLPSLTRQAIESLERSVNGFDRDEINLQIVRDTIIDQQEQIERLRDEVGRLQEFYDAYSCHFAG